MVKRSGQTGAGVAALGDVLEDVRRRFARFRRTQPRGTRIPVALRAAVVSAVRQGVTRGALERTCGISSGQVTAWQRELKRRSARPRARVFEVVDDPPAPAGAAEGGQELALRLGPWCVTVRLEGAPCSR